MCIFFSGRTIDDFKPLPTNYASHECRRKVPIAVIDDEGLDASLLRVLQANGFILEQFNDIQTVSQIHRYSVILCDIRGVGLNISPEYQGAGIVSAIRKEYPTKYIITFTGSEIDRKYNAMLQEADDSIVKDAEKQEWIEKLNEAVKFSLSPVEQWYRLRTYLSSMQLSSRMLMQLESNYVSHLLNDRVSFPSEHLSKSLSPDILTILTQIIPIIVACIPK